MQDCNNRHIGNLGLPICLAMVSRRHRLGDVVDCAELLPSQRDKENISISNDMLRQAKEKIYRIVIDIDEVFCSVIKWERKNDRILGKPVHNYANISIQNLHSLVGNLREK